MTIFMEAKSMDVVTCCAAVLPPVSRIDSH